MKELTAIQLRERVDYNRDTGLFKWRMSRGRRSKGQHAGSLSNGYLLIRIDGRTYKAHRLAWLHEFGDWPAGEIDHKNGIRSDNRITNLRDVSHAHNLQNQRAAYRNACCELLGVSRSRGGKFVAQIKSNKRKHFLGHFNTAEEAHAAYMIAKKQLHPGAIVRDAIKLNPTRLVCTRSETCGVRWWAARQKWRAEISINHKSIHLGLFGSRDEAVAARRRAELHYRSAL